MFVRRCLLNFVLIETSLSFNFAFVGDWGVSSDSGLGMTVNSLINRSKDGLEFIVLGGDNFYETGVSSVSDSQFTTTYKRYFDKLPSSITRFAILGNHDHFGNVLAQVLYSQKDSTWHMDYYFYMQIIRKGESSICSIFLDTDRINQAGQIPFLAASLSSRDCQGSDFIFAFGRHPLYSRGGHGDSPQLQSQLERLFTTHNVDAYVAGHDHLLDCLMNNNVLHIVSGAGGKKTNSSWYTSKSKADTQLFTSYGQFGYTFFTVSKESVKIEFIDSEKDIVLFTHTILSRKSARITSPATESSTTADNTFPHGSRPWDSVHVFALSFIVFLSWLGGILAIEPKKFTQIVFSS